MSKDLTTSNIHRNNILNNNYALKEIEKETAFPGILFNNSLVYTKRLVAQFYDIDERTIDRYLEQHENEVTDSGYEVLSGKKLIEFKIAYKEYIKDRASVKDYAIGEIEDDVSDTDVVNIAKAPKLGVFSFRALINIGMLLTESDRAKLLRVLILDIVIDTLNKRLGGSTRYINQREEEFLPSAIREFNYRQTFTNALDQCIVKNKWKYAQFTDLVYKSIFHENAKEYKQIIKLKSNDSVRETLYSEVLDLIAAYENGFANYLETKYQTEGRKIAMDEAYLVFEEFQSLHSAAFKPLLEKARTLMASRDMAFRDALHEKLKNYVTHLNAEEFDKFLGQKTMILEERIKENINVFKRLKDR